MIIFVKKMIAKRIISVSYTHLGHTGTLDPEAVGVLPVCLGKGTKVCDLLTDKDKVYETVMRLGVATDTQDMTGRVLKESPVEASKEALEAVLEQFRGAYSQIPPMYSALKVQGKKLYELAREGQVIERKPRQVKILDLELLEFEADGIHVHMRCLLYTSPVWTSEQLHRRER